MRLTVSPLLRYCAVAALAGLCACQPTLNWRELSSEASALKVRLPCKPDRASRVVEMAGQQLTLRMRACLADGITFAVMEADLPDAAHTGAVLAHWRLATLAQLRASQVRDEPFVLAGALGLPQSQMTHAQGLQAGSTEPVQARAVWFGNGRQVFHAVMYAPQIRPDAAEPFFDGLALPRPAPAPAAKPPDNPASTTPPA